MVSDDHHVCDPVSETTAGRLCRHDPVPAARITEVGRGWRSWCSRLTPTHHDGARLDGGEPSWRLVPVAIRMPLGRANLDDCPPDSRSMLFHGMAMPSPSRGPHRCPRGVGADLAEVSKVPTGTGVHGDDQPQNRRNRLMQQLEQFPQQGKRCALRVGGGGPPPADVAGRAGCGPRGKPQVREAVTGFVHSSIRVTAPASSKTSLMR